MKIVLLIACSLTALIARAENIPLDPPRWHLAIDEHTKPAIQSVVDKNGTAHDAIRFNVDFEDFDKTVGYTPGTVFVKDLTFHNGTIEADLVGPIAPSGRTFIGIAFRIDPKNPKQHELVYFRPFNSGTSRHAHTVQYVATDTIYDWPYLREKFPGVYEAGANIADSVWFHVRLEVDGTTVRVFVNDAADPVLVVKDLKLGDRSGLIGFWGYPGAFADLKITSRDH
jgi:hypothetical protein